MGRAAPGFPFLPRNFAQFAQSREGRIMNKMDITCGRQSSAVLLETNCISLSTSFTEMGTASRGEVVCVCNT